MKELQPRIGRIFRGGLIVTVVGILGNVALALFERFAPPRAVRFFMKRVGNPLFRGFSSFAPGWAVLEVTGHRTGRPHRVNVGGRVKGDSFRFLARSGADYVRNLRANPKVRLLTHGRWRDGVAVLLPDEDPRWRLFTLNPVNRIFLWLVRTELLAVRVELESK